MSERSEKILRFRSALINWLRDDSSDIDIAKAQFKSTRRQAPYLYFIYVICAWTVAITHLESAPAWYVLCYPVLLSVFVARRMTVFWLTRGQLPETLEALNVWRYRTQIVALIAPFLFTLWALSLFPSGTDFAQSQILLTILIGNVSTLFSLTHLRSIAIISAGLNTLLFTVFFAWYGDPAYQLMSVFGIVVTFFVSLFEMNTYRDFISLIKTGKKFRDQKYHLEQKQKETEELSELNYKIANTDHLTGIANWRYFRDTLERDFKAARPAGEGFGLCIFDIGGLKSINEVYGLEAGDHVVKEVARRLSAMETNGLTVGRIGGDEFGFFGSCIREKFEQVKTAFEHLLNEPIQTKQGRFLPVYSAGIAKVSDDGICATELLERANFALSVAKGNRNYATVFYDEALNAERLRNKEILKALQCAELKSQLSLAYQPIVNIYTNTVQSVECLARWRHPDLGNVSPADFIPLAEKSGVINQISLDLLDRALKDAKDWPAGLEMSFNLSASNLSSSGFIIDFLRIVKQHGVDPSRLSCEVTETSVMWDFKESRRGLDLLKDAGIKISLDDFGTGYSSLSHIHSLPLDCIKVDRSFVSGIHPQTAGYGIVKSLLALSRDMGIDCVVEGVETEEELAVLKELGTCCVQGYLFSKPVPAEEIKALLKTGLIREGRPSQALRTQAS